MAGNDLGGLLDGLLGGGAQGGGADEIARQLPQVVDRLTPQGQVPSGSLEDLIRRQNL